MLELHFIRTMLDILDFNIIFQGEKEEDLYTKEFIKEETCEYCEQFEPLMRSMEPSIALIRAAKCERESQ